MADFFMGVASSLTATFVIFLITKYGWPALSNKILYRGVRVDGTWDIVERRDGQDRSVGKIELRQTGQTISGESVRSKTRDGKQSYRKFTYKGSIHGHQVTLLFEDQKGVGFDTGSYVFIVQNDGITMVGKATFYGKRENRILAESRTLRKIPE